MIIQKNKHGVLVVISDNGYEISPLMLAPASFQKRIYEFMESKEGKKYVKELAKRKRK